MSFQPLDRSLYHEHEIVNGLMRKYHEECYELEKLSYNDFSDYFCKSFAIGFAIAHTKEHALAGWRKR